MSTCEDSDIRMRTSFSPTNSQCHKHKHKHQQGLALSLTCFRRRVVGWHDGERVLRAAAIVTVGGRGLTPAHVGVHDGCGLHRRRCCAACDAAGTAAAAVAAATAGRVLAVGGGCSTG